MMKVREGLNFCASVYSHTDSKSRTTAFATEIYLWHGKGCRKLPNRVGSPTGWVLHAKFFHFTYNSAQKVIQGMARLVSSQSHLKSEGSMATFLEDPSVHP